MLKKLANAQFKALTDENGATTFTGYAAVFGNVDLGGDLIVKGAFASTLKDRYENGAGIPVYWEHDTGNPYANLGLTTSAVEDDHGLLITATIDETTDYGKQVAKLLKEGRVTQMSFAFDVQEGAFVDSEELGSYYELRKLDLFEVSIVPIGMNQATEIVSVKSLMRDKEPSRVVPDAEKDADAQATARRETAARRILALDM